MLGSLYRGRKRPQNLARVPAGSRVYAIGDIHGRADLLRALLSAISSDNAARGPATSQLILLGDLIDRGPDSAQIVEMLSRRGEEQPPARFLLGNHEEVFLEALKGNSGALRLFAQIGGRETILSYGITAEQYTQMDYPELLATLQCAVPREHIEFLSGFEDMITLGDYVFVHAGVRPNTPLAKQKTKDLRWIRGDFTEFKGSLEKVVVHGHTITDTVEILPNRIGIDTGAYASGTLSAIGLEGDQRWVLQVHEGALT